MPDLEVCGGDYAGISKRIGLALKDAPYAGQLSLVRGSSVVTDLAGRPQTFVRIWSTRRFSHTENLVARLQALNLEVVEVELRAYHPKPRPAEE